MNDISDLASLGFEDLAQADLFDLVSGEAVKDEGEDDSVSRSSSPVSVMLGQEQSYTHITLINGEQICLRDEEESSLEWRTTSPDWDESPETTPDTMDLNSILQAGVVERVSSTVSGMDDLDWDQTVSSSMSQVRPRHTILASQLPLPVPARLRHNNTAVVINNADSPSNNNNNNSLLRSALIGKQSTNESILLSSTSGELSPHRTVLATVKVLMKLIY